MTGTIEDFDRAANGTSFLVRMEDGEQFRALFSEVNAPCDTVEQREALVGRTVAGNRMGQSDLVAVRVV